LKCVNYTPRLACSFVASMKCLRTGKKMFSEDDESDITTDISGFVGWLMRKIGALV